VTHARPAATWLLAVLLTGTVGCHAVSMPAASPAPERASIYNSVLVRLLADSGGPLIVLDTLLPSTDVDAEQHDKVLSALSIDRPLLTAFLVAQSVPGERVPSRLWSDARWSLVSIPHLDSLRAAARAEVVRSTTSGATIPQATRTHTFWQQWSQRYPGSWGYVVLSPAGLSPNGDTGLVQVRTRCGPVCGVTELLLLRRDGRGNWSIVDRVRLSES
jgi:hypothetical protein